MLKDNIMKNIGFKVVSGIVVLIIISAVSFVGARMANTIDKVNDNKIEVELVKKDVEPAVEDIEKNVSTLAIMDADFDRLDKLATRLEAIVERLEKAQ